MVKESITKNFFDNYINSHQIVIQELKKEIKLFEKISKEIASCLKSDGTVFWCGNGGSMGDASHLAAELVGKYEITRHPLRSIALGSDNAILSCIANDFGYEKIFSRELIGIGKKDDYLIILSTSGNSKNIIDVINIANEIGIKTFAMLGKGGGKAKHLSKSHYIIPEFKTSIIQEVQITIGHIICEFVEYYLNINPLN